jgi:RimJ/RimL family protein N-acetyltransferase
MQFQLTKSVVRSFRPTDAPALVRYLDDTMLVRNMNCIPHPYSLQHAADWIEFTNGLSPRTHFAITIDDEVVGGIGFSLRDARRAPFSDHCSEIGYWLGEPFWNRGIVTEALMAVTHWAFTELPVVRFEAPVYARNPGSMRVLEKAGYECEGRLRARYFRDGQYIDALLYAKVRPAR